MKLHQVKLQLPLACIQQNLEHGTWPSWERLGGPSQSSGSWQPSALQQALAELQGLPLPPWIQPWWQIELKSKCVQTQNQEFELFQGHKSSMVQAVPHSWYQISIHALVNMIYNLMSDFNPWFGSKWSHLRLQSMCLMMPHVRFESHGPRMSHLRSWKFCGPNLGFRANTLHLKESVSNCHWACTAVPRYERTSPVTGQQQRLMILACKPSDTCHWARTGVPEFGRTCRVLFWVTHWL